MKGEFQVLSLVLKVVPLTKLSQEEELMRGTERMGVRHSALSMFGQQDLQLRMPSLLESRFMSLNHLFRSKRRNYGCE